MLLRGAWQRPSDTNWSALFSGSGVAQQVVDHTFNDLVQTIQDSHVTTSDLATVTADDRPALGDDMNSQSGENLDNQQYFEAEGGYGYIVSPAGVSLLSRAAAVRSWCLDPTPPLLLPVVGWQ